MLTSPQSHIGRFTITRHMTLVQNVRCVLDNPQKHRRVNRGLPIRLGKSNKITLVISSTDLIPRSMNPFDCESAIWRLLQQRSTRPTKIRDFPQDIHDQISRLPDRRVPIVPNLEHVVESPNQELLLSTAPHVLTPFGQRDLSLSESLLIPFPADLA